VVPYKAVQRGKVSSKTKAIIVKTLFICTKKKGKSNPGPVYGPGRIKGLTQKKKPGTFLQLIA
jgi:hypothetical protein